MTTTPPTGPPARRTGSHTSLNHLTLAPLSTGRPLIESSDYDEPTSQPASHSYASTPPRRRSSSISHDDLVSPAPTAPLQYHYQRHFSRPSSYIAARSVPTTPGILSRAHSPSRATPKSGGLGGSKSFTHLAFGALTSTFGSGTTTPGIVDAQATTTEAGAAAVGKGKRARDRARIRQNRESSEWLYRHGAALTDSARDSKGQSWLLNRASSTSLAGQRDGVMEREVRSPEMGRKSVRGSRRGSRVNLGGLGMTSTVSTRAAGTPAAASEAGDYFGGSAAVEGPDFVGGLEAEEDDEDVGVGNEEDERAEEEQERRMDDAEIARLARESQDGFGLGGLVDRFVSWSLFDAGGEGRREEEEEEMRVEQSSRLKRVRDSQAELARLAKAERRRMVGPRAKGEGKENERGEEGSGWGDAAWLLSVASKVIF